MSRKTETKEGTLGLGDFNGKESREMIARKNSKVGILTGQIEVPKQKGFLSRKTEILDRVGDIFANSPFGFLVGGAVPYVPFRGLCKKLKGDPLKGR